jgi:hypothetical protein
LRIERGWHRVEKRQAGRLRVTSLNARLSGRILPGASSQTLCHAQALPESSRRPQPALPMAAVLEISCNLQIVRHYGLSRETII